jgi:enoyl-CoA hydratase/carnithine racemase
MPLQDAVELLAFGATLTVEAALGCGLADAIADRPVRDAAVAFAMSERARADAVVPARPQQSAFHRVSRQGRTPRAGSVGSGTGN